MGVRGELFTTEISLENRTYFFNVKENRTGDVFLQVVESKNLEGSGFDRHAVVVFEDDMQKFLQGLESTLQFIEKNRKNKLKEAAERGDTGKKKFVRRSPAKTAGRTEERDASEPKAPRATPKRVKVISRKDQKKD
jgi:Protein of unknown function (DUF3276).